MTVLIYQIWRQILPFQYPEVDIIPIQKGQSKVLCCTSVITFTEVWKIFIIVFSEPTSRKIDSGIFLKKIDSFNLEYNSPIQIIKDPSFLWKRKNITVATASLPTSPCCTQNLNVVKTRIFDKPEQQWLKQRKQSASRKWKTNFQLQALLPVDQYPPKSKTFQLQMKPW